MGLMTLGKALRLRQPARVAFTGAGGKTTAMFRLARELEGRVIVTASTHLSAAQAENGDRHVTLTGDESYAQIEATLGDGITVITGLLGEDRRTSGLSLRTLAGLHEIAVRLSLPILVEADGSRQRPLKAPGPQEPVVPEWIEQVVVVAGLSGVGKPFGSDWVHRPEAFSRLSELQEEDGITGEAIVKVLADRQGGLKGIPYKARVAALLNQADTPELQSLAGWMAGQLLGAYSQVIVACLPAEKIYAVYEPLAGIVLAAGGSLRLGKAKQTLEWRGEALVRHVVRNGLASGLAPMIVVTGSSEAEVKQALTGLPVVFASNPEWASGQSSSVRRGLQELPEAVGGAVFFLSDQPQIPAELIRSLIETHTHSLSPVVAPLAGGKRGNPVLFDRVTFGDLRAIEGDRGGRAIFDRYPVDYISWLDENILLDVDTPEDYSRLLALE
jgi:molybdenum cofactor cytidylyltransferase